MVTIETTLLSSTNGNRLWTRTYNCTVRDLAVTEGNIVQEVASVLTGDLGVNERGRGMGRTTSDPEAHTLYLQGSYWLHRWSESTIDKGIDLLEKAVALDPKFAAAQAALAEAYVQKAFTYDSDPSW